MGFHIHLRGALEYPSPEDAASAYRALAAHGDWIVESGVRLDGTRLVVSFKDFVGDPSDTLDALVGAAATAVAGKILYDDEAGERLQIPAGAPGIGHAPAPGEHVDKVRLAGAWTFASADEAHQALELLATALVHHPPRALSARGAVLTLRFEGRGPARTADAVKRALFAIAPRVRSGTMRHQHLGIVTVVDAPVESLEDVNGEPRMIRYAGALEFRNERVRDEVLSGLTIPGVRAKGKRKIVVDQQGTIGAARVAEVRSAFDALVRAASEGDVTIETAEERRVLRAEAASLRR